MQTDGKILAGGDGFARLSNDTPALQKLTASQFFGLWNVSWTRGGSSPQFTRVTFEISNDNLNYSLLGEGRASGRNWF